MNKIKLISVSINIFIILFSILIISCSENLVSPIQEDGFDSARFNITREKGLIIDARDFYMPDTSNVYCINFLQLAYIQGNNVKYFFYGDNFQALSINGYDNNNIYIGGTDFYAPTNQEKPRLKKWIGDGFQEIPIPDTSNKGNWIGHIFFVSENELWLGCRKGLIYRYDGLNFTKYIFDTTYEYGYFLRDEYGTLFCSQYRDSFNAIGTYGKFWFQFYKFINNNWELTSSHIFETGVSQRLYPVNVGNEMLAVGEDGIYKFDGINFWKIINLSQFNPGFPIGGTGSNNLMVWGNTKIYTGNYYFFHWNGNKWSVENKMFPISIVIIRYVENTFVGFEGYGPNSILYFLRK